MKRIFTKVAAGAAAIAAAAPAFAIDATTQIAEGKTDTEANVLAIVGIVIVVAGLAWFKKVVK